MKNTTWVKVCSLLILTVFTISGCFGKSSGDTTWKYEKTIKNPIKAVSSAQDITIGNLEQDQVVLTLPGNTFTTDTEVVLSTPDKVPNYYKGEMIPLGSPFDIAAGSKEMRLNQPVTVTVKLNPAELDAETEKGSLYVAYFNGKQWQYIKPVVDMEKQTMTFTTSHFCLFGTTKLTVEERIKKYTANEALASWAQEQSNQLTNKAAEQVIDHILKEKLKIADESVKAQVLGSLLKDDEWGDMVKGLAGGDVAGFNKGLQVLAGKKIAENVPSSTLSKALGGLTSDFGVATVEKASQAAGFLAEGRNTDAARIIGEHIADQFIFTTAAKVAIAGIEHQISSWKNEEVEAAYQVFKNGASSKVPWWGYQVEKGNFDDVWTQMGGAARQLEIEAIRKQEKIRKEAGMPELNEAEKDKIRAAVAANLKQQFEQRVKTDAEIAAKAEQLKKIIDMYQSAGLLEKGRFGWEKGYEVEQRLDVLKHFAEKVLKDTGRTEFKDGTGHNEKAISVDELKTLSMTWFGTSDPAERWAKYAQLMKDYYGISLYPTAEELNGTWNSGTLTITDFAVPEANSAAPPVSDGKTPDSCDEFDFSDLDLRAMIIEALQENKGKPMPVGLTLTMNASGSGILDLKTEDQPMQLNATYKDGHLTATKSEGGMNASFEAGVIKNPDGLAISGTFKLSGTEDPGFWIAGVWSARK